MRAIPTLALAVALLTPNSLADGEEQPATPIQAAFLFEWINLDHRTANKLVRKHATKLSAGELRKELAKLIEADKAELAQTAYIASKHQLRAKTESIDELIYPTEYDPPELPARIEKNTPAEKLEIAPANPTAFDVRNVGTTIEIEPVISADGKTVSLNLAPEIVTHVEDRGVGDPKTVPKPLAVIKHPLFHVMKSSSTLILAADDFTLAGVFTPPGKPGKRTLLLVRTKVLNHSAKKEEE